MCKTWAKVVCTQRIGSGCNVHSHATQLWIAIAAEQLSPALSPLTPTVCTQIVHKPVDKITPVFSHLSAESTGPTTTITTYINI